MKRNITTLLVVLMSMLGMPALAHDIEVANDDGVTIYYNFRNDNTELSVTYGNWAMYGSSNLASVHLAGRRLKLSPKTKGVYIVNGKKVVR